MKTFLFLILTLPLMGLAHEVATPSPKFSNLLSSATCAEGEVRSGYVEWTITAGKLCATGVQTCLRGRWLGPELYDSCDSHSDGCGSAATATAESGLIGSCSVVQ